jgi:hypothetical protein
MRSKHDGFRVIARKNGAQVREGDLLPTPNIDYHPTASQFWGDKGVIMKLAAMTGAGIALLSVSVFPAVALVGGASEAGHSISRSVVMVVGSDKTYCSGVVIARDLVLTAAQCISPATRHGIIGFDAPRTLKKVAGTIVHPDWDSTAILRHRVTADVALLKLALPLPPAYMPVPLADPKVVAVGSQVTVAGYGTAKPGDGKSGGKLRAAVLVVIGNPGTVQIRLVDPDRKGDVAGLGACKGDSGGPVFEESDGQLAVLGLMSWSTGPALTSGCGGLTGATPIVRYRDWVIKTAAAMGSVLNAMAPAEISNKANSPKPAE